MRHQSIRRAYPSLDFPQNPLISPRSPKSSKIMKNHFFQKCFYAVYMYVNHISSEYYSRKTIFSVQNSATTGIYTIHVPSNHQIGQNPLISSKTTKNLKINIFSKLVIIAFPLFLEHVWIIFLHKNNVFQA